MGALRCPAIGLQHGAVSVDQSAKLVSVVQSAKWVSVDQSAKWVTDSEQAALDAPTNESLSTILRNVVDLAREAPSTDHAEVATRAAVLAEPLTAAVEILSPRSRPTKSRRGKLGPRIRQAEVGDGRTPTRACPTPGSLTKPATVRAE